MIYGYARVSTKNQLRGNSLEEQTKKLAEAGAEKILTEQCSGKTTDRPVLTNLISQLQKGDTLICTKLDRFARFLLHNLYSPVYRGHDIPGSDSFELEYGTAA